MSATAGGVGRRLAEPDDGALSLREVLEVLLGRIALLVLAPLAAGLAALGATYLIAPTFTATTTFLPPQQSQSTAASALAALGSLGSLAGVSPSGGLRTPADQYIALMQSVTVSDRIIDRFKLIEAYEARFRVDARRALAANVRISVGKRDGLITIEVDDTSPQRAAEIANRYVEELRQLTSTLAVTEAQQRRVFFEDQLKQTRDKLAAAQTALQASGFNQGALRAEPRTAAEGYARLRAELTAAQVRLQALRSNLADETPEVRQLANTVAALREQVARVEQSDETSGGPGYVGRYREFKYQETLFELFARQYELARVDESREGALIQVVDTATPPERKSKPKRALIAVTTTLAVGVALMLWLVLRASWQRSNENS